MHSFYSLVVFIVLNCVERGFANYALWGLLYWTLCYWTFKGALFKEYSSNISRAKRNGQACDAANSLTAMFYIIITPNYLLFIYCDFIFPSENTIWLSQFITGKNTAFLKETAHKDNKEAS